MKVKRYACLNGVGCGYDKFGSGPLWTMLEMYEEGSGCLECAKHYTSNISEILSSADVF